MFLRLAFAVAVHTDPDVFLVDEILAVGDEPFQDKCLRRIEQLSAEGRTLVVVSHDLALIERLCHRGVVLEHGRMVVDGPVAEADHAPAGRLCDLAGCRARLGRRPLAAGRAGAPRRARWPASGGCSAAGLVPVLSAAVIAVTAVAGQAVGLPLGRASVVVGTAAAVLVVSGVRVLGAATGNHRGVEPDGWPSLVAGLGGAAAGAVALGVGLARGIGQADRWPQTFDAVFHLSAVDHVLRTGDGSALTLGALVTPEPGSWLLPGRVARPRGPRRLVDRVRTADGGECRRGRRRCGRVAPRVRRRHTGGRRPGPRCTGGGRSARRGRGGIPGPAHRLRHPVAQRAGDRPPARLPGPARGPPRARAGTRRTAPGGLGAVGAAVAGLGLAHPNAVVALAVVGAAALVVGWWGRGARRRALSSRPPPRSRWVVPLSPAFDAQRRISWPARERLPQALGEWPALAPQRVPVPLLVAGLALVGCVVAVRRPGLRWVLAVHITAGALFVLVAGSDGTVSRLVSGAWWDDPFRLAALVGLAGVPLAAIGARLPGPLGCGASATGRRSVHRHAAPGVAVALVVVVTGGLHSPDTARVVATWYRPDSMLAPAERTFVATIDDLVPEGQRVAGNPWDGAALTGPLAGREAVFPHLVGSWGPDRDLLATSLSAVATTDAVCAALARLNVGYVLTGPSGFWSGDPRRQEYDGLDVAGRPGFSGVARAGRVSLWRVTACDG